MENIEFGVNFYHVVFYGRDTLEYDSMYEKSLSINRESIPSICVQIRYKHSDDVFNDNHYEEYTITESVLLNSIFYKLLFRKLENYQITLPNNNLL